MLPTMVISPCYLSAFRLVGVIVAELVLKPLLLAISSQEFVAALFAEVAALSKADQCFGYSDSRHACQLGQIAVGQVHCAE